MKKKSARKIHHRVIAKRTASADNGNYLVIVRGWMFLVLVALMLGLGAVVGGFINDQLTGGAQVAGVQTER